MAEPKWYEALYENFVDYDEEPYTQATELRWLLEDAGFEDVSFFAVTGGGYTREGAAGKNAFEFGATASKAEP